MTKHTWAVGQTGKTRDGRDYRVICVDALNHSGHPLVGLIQHGETEVLYFYYADGTGDMHSGADLLPPPPKTRMMLRWLTIHHALSVSASYDGAIVVPHVDETSALGHARQRGSLMPEGKPLRIEIEVLEEPRS